MNFVNKCINFAMSLASRGLVGNKADLNAKKLRVLSCFGNNDISPCPHLLKSQKFETHYCGACGCGDKPHTQLTINGEKYSKLDYPYLICPLSMPGFSNYSPAGPKEVFENSRKSQIETYDILKLQEIQVSSPNPSEEEYMVFQKLSKLGKSSQPK